MQSYLHHYFSLTCILLLYQYNRIAQIKTLVNETDERPYWLPLRLSYLPKPFVFFL